MQSTDYDRFVCVRICRKHGHQQNQEPELKFAAKDKYLQLLLAHNLLFCVICGHFSLERAIF